jgi:hypothetical protein
VTDGGAGKRENRHIESIYELSGSAIDVFA